VAVWLRVHVTCAPGLIWATFARCEFEGLSWRAPLARVLRLVTCDRCSHQAMRPELRAPCGGPGDWLRAETWTAFVAGVAPCSPLRNERCLGWPAGRPPGEQARRVGLGPPWGRCRVSPQPSSAEGRARQSPWADRRGSSKGQARACPVLGSCMSLAHGCMNALPRLPILRVPRPGGCRGSACKPLIGHGRTAGAACP
jgi:hypothetical protein